MKVLLNSTKAAKRFCVIAGKYPFKIYVRSGFVKMNAKSLLGVFALDISSPLDLIINDKNEAKEFLEEIKEYIV